MAKFLVIPLFYDMKILGFVENNFVVEKNKLLLQLLTQIAFYARVRTIDGGYKE